MRSRQDRAALVTGASTGIGREIARLFAADGHDLVLVARSEAPLRAFGDELHQRHGVHITSIAEDLSIDGAAQRVQRVVQDEAITVSHVVNNAGVGLYGEFASSDLEADLRLIHLNISSLVALTHLLLPQMLRARRGRILNVASTAAFLPGPLMAVYYASKAFVLSFSEALRDELRQSGVTVSVLCPGPTDTEFQQRAGLQTSKLMRGVVMDAESVARAGYRGMMRGKSVIIPGAGNRIVPPFVRLFPRRFVTAISRRAAARKHPS